MGKYEWVISCVWPVSHMAVWIELCEWSLWMREFEWVLSGVLCVSHAATWMEFDFTNEQYGWVISQMFIWFVECITYCNVNRMWLCERVVWMGQYEWVITGAWCESHIATWMEFDFTNGQYGWFNHSFFLYFFLSFFLGWSCRKCHEDIKDALFW